MPPEDIKLASVTSTEVVTFFLALVINLRKLLIHHSIQPTFGETTHNLQAPALFVDHVGGFWAGGKGVRQEEKVSGAKLVF